MTKSLTDQELKTQLRQLNSDKLVDYSFKVIRNLEEYQAKELTQAQRLEELEKDISLAAEVGKTLLENKKTLEERLSFLERQLEGRINQAEAAELKKALENYAEKEYAWDKKNQELNTVIKKIKQEGEKNKKRNDNLDKEAREIGSQNENLTNQIDELKRRIKKQQEEIKESKKDLEKERKEMTELNDNLLEEKELLTKEKKEWEKKETERQEMIEKIIKEYEDLNQQYNKLVQTNNNLEDENLLLKQKEKDSNQENIALQNEIEEIENKERIINKGSSPLNKKISLEDELKKADELKTAKEKIAELEGLLNQQIPKKDENLEKRLILAEIKFNDSQNNASQLSEKLAKKEQELKAIQKENSLLNNQLAKTKGQLIETTKLKANLEEEGQNQKIYSYWENKENKKK